nr:hypothetical protein Iba_chr13bCG12450 [Ipomoea batatas]
MQLYEKEKRPKTTTFDAAFNGLLTVTLKRRCWTIHLQRPLTAASNDAVFPLSHIRFPVPSLIPFSQPYFFPSSFQTINVSFLGCYNVIVQLCHQIHSG